MMKKHEKRRHFIQTVATMATNGYLLGFLKGKIYTGNLKVVCVPGLNCYSCPGAAGACPIGAIQAVLGGRKHNFTFYVLGILMLFATLLGRFICGFLCPFGFLQDLLYKIKTPKLRIPSKPDKVMRYVKYIVLMIAVIALPILLTNQFGIAAPYFCKWICPAGTLEGGIPLLLSNEGLRNSIGFLFHWKLGILIAVIVSSILIYRPFCKYLCPLGAFYSLFNRVSLYRMELDKSKCTNCAACERVCKMNVEVRKNVNALECIRCGACAHACGKGAITVKFGRATLCDNAPQMGKAQPVKPE